MSKVAENCKCSHLESARLLLLLLACSATSVALTPQDKSILLSKNIFPLQTHKSCWKEQKCDNRPEVVRNQDATQLRLDLSHETVYLVWHMFSCEEETALSLLSR
jgi:hypothetical protein